MSLQSVANGAEDIVGDNDSHSDSDGDGESGATRRDKPKTVLHYRVELPPYFHGDGKDKESFSLWKTRLELAVKACAEGQQLDIATILPTRLSGDALAYWLSLPPDVQQDYDECAAKLNEVFGRKQFLLHFQTFVNARQRLPKEPLEVYAAEVTRLVLEAFPEYGKPAIAMERFRRFVAGLDPILQSKCHEHGAATLEDALAVACKWERAQEALKLLPPPVIAPALTPSAIPAPQEELFAAMVSTRHKKSQSDPSSGLFEAVKQLSNDLHALRLEVSQLGRNPDLAAQHCIPHVAASTQRYDQQDEQRYQRGRERYRRSPSASPDRGGYSPARHHHRSSWSHSDHDHHRFSRSSSDHRPRYPSTHRDRRYSPTPPSSSPHRYDHHSAYQQDRFRRGSPDRRYSPHRPGPRDPHHGDSHRHASNDSDRSRYDSHSPLSARQRHQQRGERDYRVSFTEEDPCQGKEW